eukprot:m.40933 g.40933  ORF g.40933 m.40933 type:complete len:187 (-) comp11764_c0_seq2:155-715(-)
MQRAQVFRLASAFRSLSSAPVFRASSASSRVSSSSSPAVSEEQTSSLIAHQQFKRPQFIVNPRGVDNAATIAPFLSGVPVEQVKARYVRITIPTRNVMQSGESKLNRWTITWDTKERWENPLMGWASTADPLSNMEVRFDSKEDAIAYCERNGWSYYVHEPERRRRMKKNYGNNFAWDKRTRKNTK